MADDVITPAPIAKTCFCLSPSTLDMRTALCCRAIQCLGLLLGLIGFGLGFAIAGGWNGRFPVSPVVYEVVWAAVMAGHRAPWFAAVTRLTDCHWLRQMHGWQPGMVQRSSAEGPHSTAHPECG